MNSELKSLIQLAVDGLKVGQDVIQKKDFVLGIVPDLYKAASDIPAVAANWGQLEAEIKALAGSTQEADLIAYIISKFDGADNAKAQKILSASLNLVMNLVQNSIALKDAINS